MKIHYEIGCGFLGGDSEVVPWLCGKGGYICQGVGNSIENANSAVKVIHLVQTSIFHWKKTEAEGGKSDFVT